MKYVKGLDKITKSLVKMGKISNKDVKPILAENAELLASTMRSLVRVDTGRLRNAIKVMKVNDADYKKTVLVGVDFTPDGLGTMTIAALAHINEYGTVPQRMDKKGRIMRFKDKNGQWVSKYETRGVTAQPFIRPALDMVGSQVQQAIIEDTQKMIFKEAKKNNLI